MKRTSYFSLIASCCLLAANAYGQLEVNDKVLQSESKRIAAIAKATKPSVAVFSPGGGGGGSGVVISKDGFALTNFHVVKPAGNYMQCSMSDGNLYDAVIVGIDPVGDVALIKLLGRNDFPTAEMADSDKVRVGDWCFAIGNPFLLATDFQPTVTYGIVSGTHRYQYPAGTLLEYADCIQTDASINPGNSGGPLFNADGQLIGINGRGSFEKRGRVNVGVGYAISINQIKHFMGYLHSGRIVDHATLGASVSSDEDGRVVVSNILESSDAFRRGLRYGDEIVSFGGRNISTVNGFKNVLGIFPRGWRVPISFVRDGERTDTYVRLSGVHSPEQLIDKIQRAPRPQPKPNQSKPEGKEEKGDGKKGEDDGKKEDSKKGDNKKKEGKKENGKKDGDDKKPPRVVPPGRPAPGRPGRPAKKPIPKHVAKLIVSRRGFSNYYFNKLNRDRVWSAMQKTGSFTTTGDEWNLTGQFGGQGSATIKIGKAEVYAEFPFGKTRADLTKDLDQELAPKGSGGFLAALHIWQRLLRVGPEKFGDVYYLGTAELPNREGHFDVLVGTYTVTETRFYFDPKTGHLVAIEMYPEPETDPCELTFEDYRKEDGRMVPGRISIRYGDQNYGDIEVKEWKLGVAKGGDL